ncbi:MAG: ADP-ribosylglycohydrolase family protein [Deltaproteobacteria bacterium]|nr:ADP-ribosylglycohydrolase family protein [Deltaproteobacteria bacterium]
MKKRLKTLGFPSLRRFHADRPGLRLSYEVLRQVVYTDHVPRPETLFRILESMQFSSSQIRKICGMHYGDYLPIHSAAASDTPVLASSPKEFPGNQDPPPDEAGGATPLEEPGEIVSRLRAALPRIPVPGNEDFWEMAQSMARIAEQKVRRASARHAEQPFLFAGEPEAIYQFLVRRNRIPAFLSRGENLSLSFVDGIDYRDRFLGAMLGSAIGEMLGTVTLGLTSRDVQELYGEPSELPAIQPARGAGAAAPASPLLAVSLSLLPDGLLDPGKTADALARAVRRDDSPGLLGFARNLLERGLPWHEAGEIQPEGTPGVFVLPLVLLRAGNFRRLKLEAGILASLSHPHPAAIAAAIAQACAVARTLHSVPGSLDVLSFPRALSPVIAGIEPERGSKPRTGRAAPTVGRKLGAELPALLLRRAPVNEMQEELGNGAAAHEGIPFALGCFLRSPGDFAGAVLPAVGQGGDARSIAAMAGALSGAYVGASGIPERFLSSLPCREGFSDAAERLLALSRREG